MSPSSAVVELPSVASHQPAGPTRSLAQEGSPKPEIKTMSGIAPKTSPSTSPIASLPSSSMQLSDGQTPLPMPLPKHTWPSARASPKMRPISQRHQVRMAISKQHLCEEPPKKAEAARDRQSPATGTPSAKNETEGVKSDTGTGKTTDNYSYLSPAGSSNNSPSFSEGTKFFQNAYRGRFERQQSDIQKDGPYWERFRSNSPHMQPGEMSGAVGTTNST